MRIFLLATLFSLNAFAQEICEQGFGDRTVGFYKKVYQKLICPECGKVKQKCDLKTLRKMPEIVFVGENHYDSNSQGMKWNLFKLAQSDRIQIATEVEMNRGALPWTEYSMKDPYEINGKSNNIHPMESPIFYSLAMSYGVQFKNLADMDEEEKMTQLAVEIKTQPLFRAAYENLKAKFDPEILKEMDSYLETLKEPIDIKKISSFEIKIFSSIKLKEFVTQIHLETVRLAKQTFPKELEGVDLPEMKNMGDLEGLVARKFSLSFYKDRDVEFVNKINELLCEQKDTSKPLVVLVGNDHVEGMRKMLETMSNNKLKISHFKSFDQEENVRLLGKLVK